MNNQNAVVIGGGIAGLTAATYLAKAGKSVTLYEKARKIGGRAMTEQKKGFHFNLGPHALYAAGQGVKILGELGVAFTGEKPGLLGSYAVSRGRKHTFPNGAAALMTTSLFGLAAKMEAGVLLSKVGKINTATIQHLTINEWLEKEVRQPEVKDLICTLFRVSTYGNAPDLMSAGAAIAQLQMALASNVYYLDGGWQTLVDGLQDAAKSAGVKIISQVKVEKIFCDNSIRGIQLSDKSLPEASLVIAAVNPTDLCDLLENNPNTEAEKWAKKAIQVKAACLDVALKSLPQPRTTFALGVDAPLYFSVHSAQAKLAPSGGAMIHVAKYLPPNAKESAKSVEQELEQFLDLLQPDWQASLIEKRFLPSMTVANAVVDAERGGFAGRPAPAVPNINGLFIAGDWVGAEGMLADASFASAKLAAELAGQFGG